MTGIRITTVGPIRDFPPFLINSVEGTGFILGAGFLVTCWHCVAVAPPAGCFYDVTRIGPEGQHLGHPIGVYDRAALALFSEVG
jgi:hypothetical protein